MRGAHLISVGELRRLRIDGDDYQIYYKIEQRVPASAAGPRRPHTKGNPMPYSQRQLNRIRR